jgi:hypothetical protein
MANSLSVLQVKILAGALSVLREEMTLAKIVQSDFREAAGRKGESVSVSIPAAQSGYNITPSNIPPSLSDTTVSDVEYNIDNWFGSRFYLSEIDVERINEMSEFVAPQVGQAAREIIYTVNADLWANVFGSVYGATGTAGTTPFASNINAFPAVRQVLNGQLCPEGDRHCVLSYAAETNALELAQFTQYLQSGNTDALRRGIIGDAYGMRIYRDQQVPTHTCGTGAGYLTNGASLAGATSIPVNTGSGTILVGDLVTIAGQTRPSDGTLQTFTVTAALSAGSFSVSPGLPLADAGSSAVTVLGASGHYVANLAFDRNAFALSWRMPPMNYISANADGWANRGGAQSPFPDGDRIGGPAPMNVGDSEMVLVDPETNLSLKLLHLPGYHASQWEISAMWGSAVIDARRAAFILG